MKGLDSRFAAIYGADGRKSIPPERLLRALLLQMLYSVRSERMLMEQTKFRGPDKVRWMFTFAATAHNLVRMWNLTAQPA